jgi:hypothetical protein
MNRSEAASAAWQRKREAAARKQVLSRVNEQLWHLGLNYWVSIPLNTVNSILEESGLLPLVDACLLLGHDGTIHEQVAPDAWLTLSWHRMESGRYEVVAYVN